MLEDADIKMYFSIFVTFWKNWFAIVGKHCFVFDNRNKQMMSFDLNFLA
jgi:hypothetical protein